LPNLPAARVRCVLIGERWLGILGQPLARLGVAAIPVPADARLNQMERHYADMCVFHVGEDRLITGSADANWLDHLKKYGFEVIQGKAAITARHPDSIALNAAVLSGHLIHDLRHTDPSILEAVTLPRIHTKQGYTKCAVCVVDGRAVITSDMGVYKAISGLYDCMLIKPGFIRLEDKYDGFIGGSGVKLAPDILAFTGLLDRHPDYENICDFLAVKKIKPIFLTNQPCFDVGSILPVIEESDVSASLGVGR